MNLYNLTLHPTTTNVYAVSGNFLGTDGGQEIVVAQGGVFSLLCPDSSGQLNTLHSYVEHSPVFSLARLNRPKKKDRVLVVLNAVNVLIFGYTNPEYPEIKKYYELDQGKPIRFLTSDPYGKAFMFSDKKLICCVPDDKYTLIENELSTVPCSIAALHCWENIPIVAVIVPDRSGAAMKYISYYRVDLKDSHFVELSLTSIVDNEVNLVVAVPGGENGPGGVLLFSRNKIVYKKLTIVNDVTAYIPLICGFPWEHGCRVISTATYRNNSFILQTESGDVFEAILVCKGNSVSEIKITYIDTIPATSAMCTLEEGFLFMGSKYGNHALYPIGQNGEMVYIGTSSYVLRGPRGLKNLVRMDYDKSFTHLKAMKMNISKKEAIQAVALHGVGPSSSMKTMRLGAVTKWSSFVRRLHRAPVAVWTVKTDANDRFDTYVVMSFENPDSTHVFLMDGEFALGNAGVISTTSSLVVTSFAKSCILQVHRRGVRHINMSNGKIRDYKVSEDIVKVACNMYQVVVALSGGELRYYRLHLKKNSLEYAGGHPMHLQVACLGIPNPGEEGRADRMAVCLYDNKIRILCLSPMDRLWDVLTEERVSSQPESLLFLFYSNRGADQSDTLFLNVGLQNGVLIRRMMMDFGELLLLPSKYLGSTPPKLCTITMNGQPAMICFSSQTWLGYNHHGRFNLTPLYCDALQSVASYSSACLQEGVIATFGDSLGIFTVECNEETLGLKCTARKFMLQHEQEHVTIIGSDHGAFLAIEREAAKKGCLEAFADLAIEDPLPLSRTILRDARLGKSCELELELKDYEAAFSACNMNFHRNVGDGPLLVVGTDFRDSSTAGSIHIYRFREGKLLELMPSMQLEGVPQALCHFGERLLLAGIGPVLRMYELEEAELHKACEIDLLPKTRTIVSIQVHRNIIFVGDSREAIHRFEYRIAENKLYAFGYVNVPRRLTASLHIDTDIMAGADKFGNVFFLQFPPEVNRVEEGPTGTRMSRGVPEVVNEIVRFHVGDVVTFLLKASIRESDECILYGTHTGNLGAFLTLASEDVDFFLRLEKCMRREYRPLCHWDRKTDQSAGAHVIDGDLCEQFETLGPYSQEKIANEVGSVVVEILRKLGDIKNKII